MTNCHLLLKSGQNVRLAVKLTNWKLDIVSESDHKNWGIQLPLNEAVTLADKIKATSNAADDAENGDSPNDEHDQLQGDSTVVDEVQDESSDDANDQPQGDSTVVDEVQDESFDDVIMDQPQGDSTVVDEGQNESLFG